MANISKMEFPLLRLPILAVFEVLSTMNSFEIINFSMSSSKCKKIVKLYFRPGCKFELQLYIKSGAFISIEGTHTCWEYEFTSEKKDDNFLKHFEVGSKKCETLMKYSTNVIESFLNIFKYIDDLMSFGNLAFLTFDMSHFLLQNDSVIQVIKNFQRPIEWFKVYSKEDVGNDVTDMLNHVIGIKHLVLSCPFSNDFELTCPPNLTYLFISDSKWVNLKKLLDFNSSEIVLRDFELTDLDLCAFFQSWMASESHLNLEKFEIINTVKRETFAHVSQNLPHAEFDADVVRKHHRLAEWQVLLDWFNIKRNDGTWATIYLVHNNRRPDWLTLGMVVD